jgi:hypothetical protein
MAFKKYLLRKLINLYQFYGGIIMNEYLGNALNEPEGFRLCGGQVAPCAADLSGCVENIYSI